MKATRIVGGPINDYLDQRRNELKESRFTKFCMPIGEDFEFLRFHCEDGLASVFYEVVSPNTNTPFYVFRKGVDFSLPEGVSYLGSFMWDGELLFVYGYKSGSWGSDWAVHPRPSKRQ